nr:hypothetical protein [Tanacetum cinerariifolium]
MVGVLVSSLEKVSGHLVLKFLRIICWFCLIGRLLRMLEGLVVQEVVSELMEAVRRRRAYIGKIKAIGICEDGVESVRFLELLQLKDMEKCTRLLLMMKET